MEKKRRQIERDSILKKIGELESEYRDSILFEIQQVADKAGIDTIILLDERTIYEKGDEGVINARIDQWRYQYEMDVGKLLIAIRTKGNGWS